MKLPNFILFGIAFFLIILLGWLIFLNSQTHSWEQSPVSASFVNLTAKPKFAPSLKSRINEAIKIAPTVFGDNIAAFLKDLQANFANVKADQSIFYYVEHYADKNDKVIQMLLLRFEVRNNNDNNILYQNQAMIQTEIQTFWLKDNSKINAPYDLAFVF